MSLFGSLFTGVSALSAQSQAMGMISNNIANVNTTGYKRNEASFSSLVTQAGRSTIYSPGGVRASTEQTVNQQGTPQQTASSTKRPRDLRLRLLRGPAEPEQQQRSGNDVYPRQFLGG